MSGWRCVWLFGGEGTAEMFQDVERAARGGPWVRRVAGRLGVRRRVIEPSQAPAPLHILVVDRALDTRAAMVRLLGEDGYVVHATAHAARARRLARLHHFDLLITDLGSPDRPELSLLRDITRLGGARARPPVGVAVTAMQPEDYGGEAALEQAGYSAVLLKPIRFDELESLVRRRAAGGML